MQRCLVILAVSLWAEPVFAQLTAPLYEQCRLDAIFPAGAQTGQMVSVEFQGAQGGMQHPKSIVIDGPPGVTVGEIKSLDANRISAELFVADDAPPGRRAVRVVTEQAGLTNLAWFVVGRLPERTETEPNNLPQQAERVTTPVTVNGRIQAATDVDSYRFQAHPGQNLVAAVMAHGLDAHGQGKDFGLVDAQLELLDPAGKVVAESQDVLGLDPVIEYKVPAEGEYTVRVQLLGYRGFPQAVYRLSIGEIPVPHAAFPAGGQRGDEINPQLDGWNVPAETRRRMVLNQRDSPCAWTTIGGELDTGRDVPIQIGDLPERMEREPNDERTTATPLALSTTMNGRFDSDRDDDWYRLDLSSLQPVWLETFAHRHLRSPVDTLIQVYDGDGKLLQEMDDGLPDSGYEQWYDFRSPDTRLVFTPKALGVYFVKVTDANRAAGPRAVYRLESRPAEPDFEMIQFPDAVPVWGPGSTTSLLVKIERRSGLDAEIDLAVEGLPPGWTSSRHTNIWKPPQNSSNYSTKQFLTITAPVDAPPGTVSEFRIVGRAKVGERLIERTAYPLTLFYTSDTGFFRISPSARVAVARSQGPTLAAVTREVTLQLGETAMVPVEIVDSGELKEISLNANVCSNGVAANWGAPQSLKIEQGRVAFPLQAAEGVVPGNYSLVIARSWRADIRVGMPGPCTESIQLTVLPK